MLTAKDMPGDVGQAILEGVNGYFAKPYDPAILGPTLKHKLKNMVKN
jgi:CheY-like chemotaxis protein